MELLYIWIDNFRSIKQQGFNFGGKYTFSFDCENDKLFCEENSLFIKDFFGSKIKNVTALIGKNGSGKSTFLDFIKLNISADIGGTNLSYLCLFKIEGREEIFIYNSTRKKLKLPKGKEKLFAIAPKGRIDGDLASLRYLTAFIFYSPILDFNYNTQYSQFDISTTNLLRDMKLSEFQASSCTLDDLILKEVKSQLYFASNYSNILPFKLPETLIMSPNLLNEKAITRHYNKNIENDFFNLKIYQQYREIIKTDLYEKRSKRELHYTEISESIFWHSIHYLLLSNKKAELSNFLSKNSFDSTSKNPTWELLKNLYTEESVNKFLPRWTLIESFFNQLRDMNEDVLYYFWARFNFEINPLRNFKKVDKLLSVYSQLSVVGDFLRFNWSGLSSGQQSLFAMFARFYQIKDKLKSFVEEKSNNRVSIHGMSPFKGNPEVVIMLDEGESHLHPQWQKEFINIITEYLPDIIGVSKIQLILASNSPFLISDLPHYNVVFLDEKNGKTKVKETPLSTFAANIHDLLSQSFFLDSTIGSLAENKINEVIQWLNQDQELTTEQADYLHKVLKLIDDLPVQDKLLQMLSLKIENNNWDEYLLKQQRKLIDEKLNRIRKNRDNA